LSLSRTTTNTQNITTDESDGSNEATVSFPSYKMPKQVRSLSVKFTRNFVCEVNTS